MSLFCLLGQLANWKHRISFSYRYTIVIYIFMIIIMKLPACLWKFYWLLQMRSSLLVLQHLSWTHNCWSCEALWLRTHGSLTSSDAATSPHLLQKFHFQRDPSWFQYWSLPVEYVWKLLEVCTKLRARLEHKKIFRFLHFYCKTELIPMNSCVPNRYSNFPELFNLPLCFLKVNRYK